MKKITAFGMLLILLGSFISPPQVKAEGEVWELAETRLTPANGSAEKVVGTPLTGEERYTLENMGGYHKYTTTVGNDKIVIVQNSEDWDTSGADDIKVSYTITKTFAFETPDTMTPGEVVTFKVTGTVSSTGQLPTGYNEIGDNVEIEGGFFGGPSFQYVVGGEERFSVRGSPPGPVTKSGSVSYKVPEGRVGEEIHIFAYASGGVNIEWIYRATEKMSLSLDYSPPLVYFEPGTGADIEFAGELVATLKDEDDKGIEGKTILFFIDKEVPGANEPGKNLFDVLAYEVAEGTGSLGSIEIHEFLTKRIVNPELDESLFREDRIFLGNGAKTDSNGEAIINVIEYDIIDPKKFSGELIDQRVAFSDKGKVSGTIIAGVYDEETKFIVSQVALEIEYQAMAKILQITGEGRSDDTEIGRKYPGKVRVKRILALPKFDYTPVEEGFLLMPGDIVDIDGNAAVEIAWINGDKVIARVPDKIQVGNVIEPYEPAESQIFMLSSAYDSGFLTTGEKIYNTVFGFGAKKGVEMLVESIPYVGKLIKEGGALVIEIHEDLKDIDLSQSDIVTRIRIRSKVIIDNTGEELKVYNLEGSPDIKTVGGGEVTLAEGKMVVVSDEGVLGEVQTFNVKELEEEFYETALAIQRTDSSGSGAKGGSSSTGVIIGVIAVVVVALALLVMRKRVKKA